MCPTQRREDKQEEQEKQEKQEKQRSKKKRGKRSKKSKRRRREELKAQANLKHIRPSFLYSLLDCFSHSSYIVVARGDRARNALERRVGDGDLWEDDGGDRCADDSFSL